MSPRLARALAAISGGLAVLVWFAMPDALWQIRAALVVALALVAGTCFDRSRFAGGSRTESTMGPAGDVLVGFQARVVSVAPLKVEARGTIWSARLEGLRSVSPRALVEIVGRDGLTILVRPADEAGTNVKTSTEGKETQ
jgi:membrane protein implicated in regulation of membrane protease activity